MKSMKLYEADDKMIDLISDNYSMLQGLNAFGIQLGFGDKTVEEVCRKQNVDCHTFLTVVNFLINGYTPEETDDRISVSTLLGYLRASHHYFLDFQLPSIRAKLQDSLTSGDKLATLILSLFDEYAHDIRLHMKYEEKTLFPYVEALLHGEQATNYNVDTFAKHHNDITGKFHELKNIIIKYLPHNSLANHSQVEDVLFVPAIRSLEQNVHKADISAKISDMINNAEGREQISEREKEIIVCLVQGMSNKEVAAKLFISVNTVITHRRNITRKLQIHSLAGLTIYAIANNLIEKHLFI